MALKLVVPPIETPVTLVEAKAHLRVDTNDDDALISSLIQVATQKIDGKDGYLYRALKPQTYELTYDAFPGGAIAIPVRPLISIESVLYDDENGVEQVVDSLDYEVDDASDPQWIVPIADFTWPSTLAAINSVRIRFVAGYADVSGDVTTVPAPIRHAILMTIADLYKWRESASEDALQDLPIPFSVRALLEHYRVFA